MGPGRLERRDEVDGVDVGHLALDSLSRQLQVCFRNDPPPANGRGREQVAKMLVRMVSCQPASARLLVRAMEREGLIGKTRRQGRLTFGRAAH